MDLISVLIVIAIIAGLMFVLRELMCWYWKVNERIELQKKTNDLLTEISKKLNSDNKDQNQLLTV